jgi:tetratricopeptide (TPR) repeat protein
MKKTIEIVLLVIIFFTFKCSAQTRQQYIDSATLNYNSGNNKAAIRDLSILIKLDSGNVDNTVFYCYRGLAESNIKHYIDAVSDYNQSIIIDPQDTICLPVQRAITSFNK